MFFFFSFFFFINVLDLKPDFLIIGMLKAGTSSFQVFFKNLGYRSAHWSVAPKQMIGDLILQAKSENLPLLHYLTSFDAITEMNQVQKGKYGKCYFPQIEDFDRLYDENKSALFILNTRNITDHVNSFVNWYNTDKFLYNNCPHLFTNVPGSTIPEKLKNLIVAHNNRIRHFFSQKPEAKFVEFNIDTDKASVFEKYFDIKNCTFPHANKSKKTQ